MVIHKFRLEIADGIQEITVNYERAHVVSVIEQNGKIMIYLLLDVKNEKREKKLLFSVVGTGQEITDPHIGTVGTVKVDSYVWHVLEHYRTQII